MNRCKVFFHCSLLAILLMAFAVTTAGAQENPDATKTMVSLAESQQGPVRHIASPHPRPRPPSTRVRVALLDLSGSMNRVNQVALLLTQYRRRDLEAHIGMKIEMANLSRNRNRPLQGNVVFYRPGFLRAAMLIAKAIPGEQSVRPMSKDDLKKSGIDVEVHLGQNRK